MEVVRRKEHLTFPLRNQSQDRPSTKKSLLGPVQGSGGRKGRIEKDRKKERKKERKRGREEEGKTARVSYFVL